MDYSRPWTFNAGIAGTFQGNFQYHAQQGGAVLEAYHIPWKADITIQGGPKWDTRWNKGAYGAILLSKQF